MRLFPRRSRYHFAEKFLYDQGLVDGFMAIKDKDFETVSSHKCLKHVWVLMYRIECLFQTQQYKSKYLMYACTAYYVTFLISQELVCTYYII